MNSRTFNMPESLRGHASPAMHALDDSSAEYGEDADGESWLISYLDMLTLLLTMFVVLLAFADHSPPEPPPEPLPKVQKTQIPAESVTVNEMDVAIAAETTEAKQELMDPLGDQLLQALDSSVQMVQEKDRINLAINERILFTSGEAELRDSGLMVLKPLIAILKDTPHSMSISGHTDNVPIATELFPSNWELSSARAASVVRYLQTQGIAAQRLRAIGYADTRPVSDNIDAEGRAANRRVEIVIHKSARESGDSL